jgi:hypothetical protein
MPRSAFPTLPDPELGSDDPKRGARVAPPALGQGRASAVRTAGTSVLALVGAGLVLLSALGGIAAVVYHLLTRAGPAAAGRLEARDLRAFRTRAGVLTIVGELQAVDAAIAGAPTARLTLLDPKGAAIATAACAPAVRSLALREKVPCAFSFAGVGSYASTAVTVAVRPLPAAAPLATLKVGGASLRRAGAPPASEVEATVQNAGTSAARHVVALVALYGGDGKIAGRVEVPIRDLEPGASASFSTGPAEAAAPVQNVSVRVVGYRD